MSKTFRNIDHAVIIRSQLNPNPFAICRGIRPQINYHIINCPSRTPDNLDLSVWRQLPPHAEVKVVRCTRGAIYDVIVDLRSDSPTYCKWIGVELTADNYRMIYIPEGFAHGYQ